MSDNSSLFTPQQLLYIHHFPFFIECIVNDQNLAYKLNKYICMTIYQLDEEVKVQKEIVLTPGLLLL